MKFGIAVVCVLSAGAGLAAQPDPKAASAADEKAVGKLGTDWTAAWNRHDAEGMASVFSEQASLINPMGEVAKGHSQILKLFQTEHAGALKQSKMALTCEPTRFLAATVAETDCDFALEGITGPQAPAVSRGHSTSIAVREGDRWSIVTMRAMIPRREDAAAKTVTPVAAAPR